jgi:hypothetical protein
LSKVLVVLLQQGQSWPDTGFSSDLQAFA